MKRYGAEGKNCLVKDPWAPGQAADDAVAAWGLPATENDPHCHWRLGTPRPIRGEKMKGDTALGKKNQKTINIKMKTAKITKTLRKCENTNGAPSGEK